MVLKIKTKQLYFQFTSYINLSCVFYSHFRVSNNRTVTIMYVCILFFYLAYTQLYRFSSLINVKFLPLGSYLRPCNYQFYLLILSCMFISFCAIIQFQSKKDYSNSLLINSIENIQFVVNLWLILIFLRNSFSFLSCKPFRN